EPGHRARRVLVLAERHEAQARRTREGFDVRDADDRHVVAARLPPQRDSHHRIQVAGYGKTDETDLHGLLVSSNRRAGERARLGARQPRLPADISSPTRGNGGVGTLLW